MPFAWLRPQKGAKAARCCPRAPVGPEKGLKVSAEEAQECLSPGYGPKRALKPRGVARGRR
ncbi:hypothetical protein A8708_21460 [Paenibacillus oryzisoli]|uniref:Uncharacterized protein n=1 Tax=Paenibacillus oryzisoli TaxID=1850517 RepID=A0A198A8B3_9BACL|nr:hypothetical protein A8708_21460 [Paenibacillus oryzisoli]